MNVPRDHHSGATGIIMIHAPSMTATGAVVKRRKSNGTYDIIASTSSCLYQKSHRMRCDAILCDILSRERERSLLDEKILSLTPLEL